MPSYIRAPPEAAMMMTAERVGRAVLDRARDSLADDGAHGRGEKTEIHHRDGDFVAFQESMTTNDRIDQSRARLIFPQPILVTSPCP